MDIPFPRQGLGRYAPFPIQRIALVA
jgi:hypothetical protein